jgi:isopropylmalate/homocitrate/citramalate synthase
VGKSLEDLLAEMRGNPANVRFADVCKVATHFFGDPRINLQDAGGKAKPYQVRQVLQAIGRLLEEKKP